MTEPGRWGVAPRAVLASSLAVAVRGLTLLLLVALAGAGAVRGPLNHLDYRWIAAGAATQLFTYPAYVVAYRSVTRLAGPTRMPLATATRIVVAGFGAVTLGSGFSVDRADPSASSTHTRRRIAAMSTIEWAVLGPATWIASVALLVDRSARASPLFLWPTIAGLPVLAVAAGWASAAGPAAWLTRHGTLGAMAARSVEGVGPVREMAAQPRRFAGAWIGTTAYWAAEIAALYAATRAVGIHLGIGVSVVAYSAGYLASRRSLPLAGAGIAEVLLVYSLDGLHVPLGAAVDAVMIYRFFNFFVAIVPALVAEAGLRLLRPV